MAEGHRAVVREVLFQEHVAVESAHLREGEDTCATVGACCHRKDLSFCDVRADAALGCALEAVERHLAGNKVAFHGALGHRQRQVAAHDPLVAHGACLESGGACVSAVEAHYCVGLLVVILALDGLLIHVAGDGVVDVKDGDSVTGDHLADVLGDCSIDIHFAAHGDAGACDPGIYIAGNESELRLECGPALGGEHHVFAGALVLLSPVS